jgi:hypothetical protein
MGDVTAYPNGTFCWIDLGTPDVAGAKAFYGNLFGWAMEDFPAGDEETYTICRLRGKDVAAIHEHPKKEGAEWSSYISVEDADQAASRAAELGARVLMDPFDVLDVGRMSLIRDPAGAVVSLWQPKTHIGARFVNEVGAWGWNELVTPDMDAAKSFYGDLFGWKAEDVPANIPRGIFTMGDLLIGGVHAPTPEEGDASRWTLSFNVADAEVGAARVEELGGQILLPPMQIPIGTFSIVSDPAGAAFTLAAVPGGPVRGVDGS